MANPTVREQTGASGTSTSLTATTSPSTAVGDLAVVFFSNDYGSVDEINNFAAINDEGLFLREVADAGLNRMHTKCWTGYITQAGPKTITCYQANGWACTLSVVVINTHYGYGNSGWLSVNTTSNSQPTPNLTPPVNDALFLTCYSTTPANNLQASQVPGGTLVSVRNSSTFNTSAVVSRALSSSAATSFPAALWDTSGLNGVAVSITIRGTNQGTSIWAYGVLDTPSFGQSRISSITALTAIGRASTAAMGATAVSIPSIAFTPTGFAAVPALGTPTVSAKGAIYPTGRASTAVFGANRISIPTITLAPAAINNAPDTRELTLRDGPIYSDASGVPAGSGALQAGSGPSGEPVYRVSRIPGREQGWGVYIAADLPGATVPAGVPVTIALWARGTSTQQLQVANDPGTTFVFPALASQELSPTEWRRFFFTRTCDVDWVPGVHRLRSTAGTSDSDWVEWSDVDVSVGAPMRVGAPSISNVVRLTASGIASTSALGAPNVPPGTTVIAPPGRGTSVAFGLLSVAGRNVVTASGIPPTSSMPLSLPALGNVARLSPPSIVRTTLFGTDLLAPNKFLIPGIEPTAVFGFATLIPPIEPEWHKRFYAPQGKTVTRPALGLGKGTKFLTVDAFTRQVTNEFSFSDVNYTFERNAPGEFSGQIGLYDPETKYLVPQQTYLVVERDGRPFWVGFLWQPDRAGKLLKVDAQGVWSIFGHRNIRETLNWEAADRAKIVRDLVAYGQRGEGGDLGLAVGSELVGSTLSYTANWWEKKSVASVVSMIAAMDPTFTFSVTGDWLPGNKLGFRFNIDPVYPRPTPHRLSYPGNVDDYVYAPLSPSPNFVDGFGGFDNAAMLRRTRKASDLSRRVRIEGTVANRDLLFPDAVDRLAADTLRNNAGSPSQPAVSMSAGVSPMLGELMPGNGAEVVISDGPYIQVDGSFAVQKLTIKVPNGAANAAGSESVGVQFASLLPSNEVEVDLS